MTEVTEQTSIFLIPCVEKKKYIKGKFSKLKLIWNLKDVCFAKVQRIYNIYTYI